MAVQKYHGMLHQIGMTRIHLGINAFATSIKNDFHLFVLCLVIMCLDELTPNCVNTIGSFVYVARKRWPSCVCVIWHPAVWDSKISDPSPLKLLLLKY